MEYVLGRSGLLSLAMFTTDRDIVDEPPIFVGLTRPANRSVKFVANYAQCGEEKPSALHGHET